MNESPTGRFLTLLLSIETYQCFDLPTIDMTIVRGTSNLGQSALARTPLGRLCSHRPPLPPSFVFARPSLGARVQVQVSLQLPHLSARRVGATTSFCATLFISPAAPAPAHLPHPPHPSAVASFIVMRAA